MNSFKKLLVRLPFVRKIRNRFRRPNETELIDRRDNALMKRLFTEVLKKGSNVIDVGAHSGDVMAEIIKLAPNGQHFAFEAIPALASQLKIRFPMVSVTCLAVSDRTGEIDFNWISTNPGFSGIRLRNDIRPDDQVQIIRSQMKRLDDLIPASIKIDAIKIDVEGAELGVLKGACRILSEDKPIVIFEHGSAAGLYGTRTVDIYREFANHKICVFQLDRKLDGLPPYTEAEFVSAVESGKYWNFVASAAE